MKHKYSAIQTAVDGIMFPSKKEAARYKQLVLLKAAGDITDFELQPKYELMPSFRHKATGAKIRAINYKADFLVTYPDGHQEIEDVKGMKTDVYDIKKKLFMNRYPELQIKEI